MHKPFKKANIKNSVNNLQTDNVIAICRFPITKMPSEKGIIDCIFKRLLPGCWRAFTC